MQTVQRGYGVQQLIAETSHKFLVRLGFGLYLFELVEPFPIALQGCSGGSQAPKAFTVLVLPDLPDFLERFVDGDNGCGFIGIASGEGVGLYLIASDLYLLPELGNVGEFLHPLSAVLFLAYALEYLALNQCDGLQGLL